MSKFVGGVLIALLIACLSAPMVQASEHIIYSREVDAIFSLPADFTITNISDGEVLFKNQDNSVWGGIQVEYNTTEGPLNLTEQCRYEMVKVYNQNLAIKGIRGKNITLSDLPFKQIPIAGQFITVSREPRDFWAAEFRPMGTNATIVTVIATEAFMMNLIEFMRFRIKV